MTYKLKISKAGYNVLTDTNVDHLVFSSDYNTLKYSLANGSINVTVNTNATGNYSVQGEITHGLGYKPFFKAYANWAGYSPVGIFTLENNHNIHLMVTVDDNKMYFIISGYNAEIITVTGTNLDVPYALFHIDRNGTFCEVFDSGNMNQCVDLATAWCMRLKDHAGNDFLPNIFAGMNAHDIYENPSSYVLEYFDRIAYTVDNSPPQKGDIVVWNTNMGGGAGHVGIATGTGDSGQFDCFQQNDDPYGGNPNWTSRCHDKTYSYNNVLGWLRYKGAGEITTITTDTINFTANFRYKIFKNKLNL